MKIILETPRLVLRTFTQDDTTMLLDLCQDKEVMKFTGEPPFQKKEDAETLLNKTILQNQYEEKGYGYWAIHLIKNGVFIGWCGLKEVEGEIFLDIRLRKRFWNKGYGTEIGKAVLRYAFTELNMENIKAKSHEKNEAAVEVMKKISMNFLKTKKVKRQRFVTYEASQNQWIENKFELN